MKELGSDTDRLTWGLVFPVLTWYLVALAERATRGKPAAFCARGDGPILGTSQDNVPSLLTGPSSVPSGYKGAALRCQPGLDVRLVYMGTRGQGRGVRAGLS